MPQEIKRSANVELIKETDHESGFSVNIDGGCINYEYMVPHVNNGMGLLFKIQFNDGYFRDLHGAVELFIQYCEQVLKLGPNNTITLDADEVNAIHKGFANYANNNYLQMFVKNNDIEVAIITTTASGAKEATELASKAHVKGIWNFSNAHINVKDIEVIDVDFSSSLAILTHKIRNKENH